MVPTVGQPAPDFTLKSHDERSIRLSDYRGKKNVVLAFFPLAWTPV
jgi:peroxiredoxin